MTPEYFNRVFDIFVKHADVHESLRNDFVSAHTDSKYTIEEYRIQGKLGFGGKYRRRWNKVNCYKEDETPEVLQILNRINYDIRALNGDIVQFKTGKAEGLFVKVPTDAYGFSNRKAGHQIDYIEDVPYKKSKLSFGGSLILDDYWNDNFEVLDRTDKLSQEQLVEILDNGEMFNTKGGEQIFADYNTDEVFTDAKDSLFSLMVANKAYPLDIADEWGIPAEKKGTWLVILKK